MHSTVMTCWVLRTFVPFKDYATILYYIQRSGSVHRSHSAHHERTFEERHKTPNGVWNEMFPKGTLVVCAHYSYSNGENKFRCTLMGRIWNVHQLLESEYLLDQVTNWIDRNEFGDLFRTITMQSLLLWGLHCRTLWKMKITGKLWLLVFWFLIFQSIVFKMKTFNIEELFKEKTWEKNFAQSIICSRDQKVVIRTDCLNVIEALQGTRPTA